MFGIYDNGQLIAKFAAPVTVESNQPIMSSDALSLKRTSAVRTAQRWEITSNVEPLTHHANDLFALIVKKGYTETFDIAIPQNYGVTFNRTSKSTPTATGAQYATTLAVINNVGLIPAGCFIKFANHNKIYMLVNDLNGNGSITVYPPLRSAVPANTVMEHIKPIMKCYKETDSVRGMVYSDGIMMDLGTLKFVEAV
jgi:hypothetical protein